MTEVVTVSALLEINTGAAIPARTPQAFTLAVPLQVDLMTNVAVR